jgi:heat shock protein HslJ
MMKKPFVSAGIFFLSVLMVLSCATSGAAENEPAGSETAQSVAIGSADSPGTVSITDIQGRDWILEEIRTNSATIRINRPDNVEAFTIRFDAQRVGGVGHPNRFTAPYTAGEAGSLSIGVAASTLMASFFEIEGLNEREYYAYLAKVKSGDIRNGKLELTTSGANGETVLVYR